MALTNVDVEFYDEKIAQIDGYLHPATARATMFLLDAQNENGIEGNLLEIGVLGGRHLALMSRFTKPGTRCFGIDPFYLEGSSLEKVEQNISEIGCDQNVEVIKARSDQFKHREYKKRFGPVRFMHIDGSHQYEDVLKDLAIAESVLKEDGLLSFDDFLNPYWLGVSQAMFEYMRKKPWRSAFRPVAFCRPKLFLCRAGSHKFYTQKFADFIEEWGGSLPLNGTPDRTSPVFGIRIPVLQ